MRTRAARFAVALVLLAAAWPAAGALLATIVQTACGWLMGHPAVLCTTAAAVLLLGTVPGPVERTLTRLATRTAPGGGRK